MMECSSCNENISHKMTFSLNKNECPFCGKAIMSEEQSKKFNELLKHVAAAKSASELCFTLMDKFDFNVKGQTKTYDVTEEGDVVVKEETKESPIQNKVERLKEIHKAAPKAAPRRIERVNK